MLLAQLPKNKLDSLLCIKSEAMFIMLNIRFLFCSQGNMFHFSVILIELHIISYSLRAIIGHGLYIFNPFFTAIYNQEWLLLQTIYVLNKEILQRFIIKSAFK